MQDETPIEQHERENWAAVEKENQEEEQRKADDYWDAQLKNEG